MINLNLWVLEKLNWEIFEEMEEANPQLLKEQEKYLKDFLNQIEVSIMKLEQAGWVPHSLNFFKEGLTKKQAQEELKMLNIDKDLVDLEEFEDEED